MNPVAIREASTRLANVVEQAAQLLEPAPYEMGSISIPIALLDQIDLPTGKNGSKQIIATYIQLARIQQEAPGEPFAITGHELAELVGMSANDVNQYIGWLAGHGWIDRDHSIKQKAPIYRVICHA